jgi:hypothetical protein
MRSYFWRQFTGFWCLMVMAAFSFLTTANAQQTLGSINGTVLDPSGAAVSGSMITVIDVEIHFTRTAKAQSNGFFQIFNLPVGTYKIQATHEGFDTTEISGISVQEAGTTTLNVTLKVGQATTSVEVTANTLLNATDSTNGYTLDKEQIALTPLATGSFTQLAVLSPGVNSELLSGLDSNAGLRSGTTSISVLAVRPPPLRLAAPRLAARIRSGPQCTAPTVIVCLLLFPRLSRRCALTPRCTTPSRAQPVVRRSMSTL